MERPPRLARVVATGGLVFAIGGSFLCGSLVQRAVKGGWLSSVFQQYDYSQGPSGLIASADAQAPDPDLRPSELYAEILRKLQIYYVQQLPDDSNLAYASVERMLAELNDTNCRMLSPAEIHFLQEAQQGRFGGLGAIFTVRRYERRDGSAEMNITLVSPIPGGPADRAGLLPGDRVIELDGHWIAPAHVSFRERLSLTEELGPQDFAPISPDEMPNLEPPSDEDRKRANDLRARWQAATDISEALQLLISPDQGTHVLTVMRGEPARELKLTVTYGDVKKPAMEQRQLDNSTGYVRFSTLTDEGAEQFLETLARYKTAGITRLVVDLRRCPGGSLDAALRAASGLIGPRTFARLQERDVARKLITRDVSAPGAPAILAPQRLVVLVDGGTAGAAEVLAAALQDSAAAALLGDPTFGDGTEEELISLENGAGFTVTRAYMLTSKGQKIDGEGLKPRPLAGDPIEAALKGLS